MHSPGNVPSNAPANATRSPFRKLSPQPGQKSARVLLVDDEMVVGEALKRLFTRQGHQVTHCASPDDALRLCRNKPTEFDIMITDQSMPEMTGYDLAISIHESCPSLPIIIQTGHLSKTLKEAIGRNGIHAVFQKPVSSKKLCEEILKSVEASHAD